jgi:hypothetical protein
VANGPRCAFDKAVYVDGWCDVMALALHRLTGLPFGAVRNREGCVEHVVVRVNDREYLDVYGIQSGATETVPVDVVDGLFATCGASKAEKSRYIRQAMRQAQADPELSDAIVTARRLARRRTR